MSSLHVLTFANFLPADAGELHVDAARGGATQEQNARGASRLLANFIFNIAFMLY